MGGLVFGTHLNIASGDPFLFSGKRLLHCTETWTERRVVAIAFTVMGSISVSPELDNLLGAGKQANSSTATYYSGAE